MVGAGHTLREHHKLKYSDGFPILKCLFYTLDITNNFDSTI